MKMRPFEFFDMLPDDISLVDDNVTVSVEDGKIVITKNVQVQNPCAEITLNIGGGRSHCSIGGELRDKIAEALFGDEN